MRGRDGYKALVTMYRNAFPDVVLTIDEQIAEGDTVVTRWTGRGTHQGELMGVAPTGKRVTVQGIIVSRFKGGKLVEDIEHYDVYGMMRQLGVVTTRSTCSRLLARVVTAGVSALRRRTRRKFPVFS